MSALFDRTMESLRQALSFAREECKHDWVYETKSFNGKRIGRVMQEKTCTKCGVRLTTSDKFPTVKE